MRAERGFILSGRVTSAPVTPHFRPGGEVAHGLGRPEGGLTVLSTDSDLVAIRQLFTMSLGAMTSKVAKKRMHS